LILNGSGEDIVTNLHIQ